MRDVKQLIWAVLLLWVIIAGLSFWSRSYFGNRTALWVGVGLAAFVAVAFALIAAAGALVNTVVDRHDAVQNKPRASTVTDAPEADKAPSAPPRTRSGRDSG